MLIPKKYILIIEDHPSAFNDLVQALRSIGNTEIIQAKTTTEAEKKIKEYQGKLELVIVDLGLPIEAGETRSPASNGMNLLRTLLKEHQDLNLAVNTGQEINLISGLKSSILEHRGGFVFIHKSASTELTARKLQIALSGNLDYRTIREELGDFTMKPKWIEALQLAAQGLDNREIITKIRTGEAEAKGEKYEYKANDEATAKNYLKNAGAVLGVYAEDSGNFRVNLINAAREVGIII